MTAQAYCQLKRGKAPGVDGQTLEDYGQNVIANLRSLVDRLHRGSYRPQPSLHRDIPKGNGQTCPLGIACVEDKVVPRAIVTVLERMPFRSSRLPADGRRGAEHF